MPTTEALINELYAGKYYHQTDMFYLAELYNRLLNKNENTSSFSYKSILSRMMGVDRENRYASFTDIKDALGEIRFSILDIDQSDKAIYQSFSSALYKHIGEFINTKEFVTDIEIFKAKLSMLISHNCFENFVQNNSELLSTIVVGRFSYYPEAEVRCSVITDFYKWFERLPAETKQLVLNNLVAKLSAVEVRIDEDDLPF